MDTLFDKLEMEERDQLLGNLESGIRSTRSVYSRIAQAMTDQEKTALNGISDANRYELIAALDQVGLLDWYYEQKAKLDPPTDSSAVSADIKSKKK